MTSVQYLNARGGNVALIIALLAPVLLGFAGGAVDYQILRLQRAALQEVADSLATRGAREFLLGNASAANIEALVEHTGQSHYSEQLGVLELDVDADTEEKSVAVRLSQEPHRGIFLHRIAAFQGPVAVSATAVTRGSANVCVIALEKELNDAIRADASAKLSAPDCSILSNSIGTSGVNISGGARLSAHMICSAGGTKGGSANFSPMPLTDCPVYDDPLSDRTPPASDNCDFVGTKIGVTPGSISSAMETITASQVAANDGSNPSTLPGYARHDLTPGVYCGGIEIDGRSDVHLAPGVYVIKDGRLDIAFGARLFGEDVGIYMTGTNATFLFEPASIIHLSAPKAGSMAGVLFWDASSAPTTNKHSIYSSNARQLLGTIYLPKGQLEIASATPVADKSAYTAIVARALRLSGAPTLVLNADYAATEVPVPEGIGPSGGQVFLRQ